MVTVKQEQIPEEDELMEILAKEKLHKKWRRKDSPCEFDSGKDN